MLFPSVGANPPLVTSPNGAPPTRSGYPCRGIPRSRNSKPASFRETPFSRCSASAARPTNSPFFHFTIQPRSASSTVNSSPMSCPWSAIFASSRSVSRAPSPAGTSPSPSPASSNRRAAASAPSAGRRISNPSSPVYPIRATVAGVSSTRPSANR